MENDPYMRKFFESEGADKIMRGFIPVVGSAEAAWDAFQEKKYIQASLYTVLAGVEAVPLVKLLTNGLRVVKAGSPLVTAVNQVEKKAVNQGIEALEKVALKGFKQHAVNQAITRGFNTSSILKIIREGKQIQALGRYGPQTRYILKGNKIIVNSKGEIITIFSETLGTRKGLGKGYFLPFK